MCEGGGLANATLIERLYDAVRAAAFAFRARCGASISAWRGPSGAS